jgi:hypothetical protein
MVPAISKVRWGGHVDAQVEELVDAALVLGGGVGEVLE